jgi:hypothetical protein
MGTPSVALSTMPRAEFASATGTIREPKESVRDLTACRAGTTKGTVPMFGSLARLAFIFAGLAFVIPDTSAHDSWISRGGHRNAAGEWCCGTGDCFVVPKERVILTGEGYVIIQGPLAGMGPVQHEAIPFSEAQPSPDGEFWRCRRPDGSRRCFFAPPPST